MGFKFINEGNGDSLPFLIFRISLVCIGLTGNVILFAFLNTERIGSTKSSILVRLQTIIDLIALMSVISAMFTHPSQIDSNNYYLYSVYCRVFHTNFFFWFCIVFSGYILVLTSIDRFIAVVFPFRYRDLKDNTYRLGIVGIFMLSLLLLTATFFETIVDTIEVTNSTTNNPTYICKFVWELETFSPFWKAFSYLWLTFGYFIPTIIMISLYSKIIFSLKSNNIASNDNADSIKKNISIKFTISTIIIFAFYIATYTIDSVVYIFNMMDKLPFGSATKYYYYCNFCLGLNAMVNPFVYVILINKFKRFVWRIATCGWGQLNVEIESSKSFSNLH